MIAVSVGHDDASQIATLPQDRVRDGSNIYIVDIVDRLARNRRCIVHKSGVDDLVARVRAG